MQKRDLLRLKLNEAPSAQEGQGGRVRPRAAGAPGRAQQQLKTRAELQAAALAAALEKRQNRKGRRQGGLAVVGPAALGRESTGPDALHALRARLWGAK
jgi:hypothetical protein